MSEWKEIGQAVLALVFLAPMALGSLIMMAYMTNEFIKYLRRQW